MKHLRFTLLITTLIAIVALMITLKHCSDPNLDKEPKTPPDYILLIHGGAGDITRETLPDSLAQEYMNGLRAALVVGHRILDTGGTALDAVEAVVRYLEDHPLFNAGKGAVFTAEGKNELDASIMDGATGLAGAVAGVTTVKNPILAARAVMEKTSHVMLAGPGADRFAVEQGLEMVDPSWFFTQKRYDGWLKAREEMQKMGTVGAVALDKKGNLAAATSTGGMTMKRYGRVGDAPVIGAGTYADNRSCAVSCTGHGEYFIRNSVAFDMAARILYTGVTPERAAHDILHKKLKAIGGTGGLIALDARGQYTMTFNTSGMFRGVLLPGGEIHVMIFDDETLRK
jgi:L-asparaginase / beta-aspartyl-peptidase